MATVSWSTGAIGDLQRLYRFLAKTNLVAASRSIATIRKSVERLERFPQGGRPARKEDARIRDWIIPFGKSGYIARYLYEGETVVILLVRHQRELL